MAHQTHNIPWQTLADTLKFKHQNKSYKWVTNLFFTHKSDQLKRLKYFTSGFISTLNEFSDSERAKYSEEYEPPSPEDKVLTAQTARNIQLTIKRCREEHPRQNADNGLMSEDEHRMNVWLNYKSCTCCGNNYDYKGHWPTLTIFKSLILHDEMDTLLRINSHPDTRLVDYWLASCCWHHDGWGWLELVRKALMVYVCLNVFFAKGETHDPSMHQQSLSTTAYARRPIPLHNESDYRSTYAYQLMLIHCTRSQTHDDTETYPHRNFFGLPSGPLRSSEDLLGLLTPEQFKCTKLRSSYVPLREDIPLVFNYLGQKGLPVELSLQVLQYAHYVPVRRPPIADNPLHRNNSSELRRYLNYCWKLLVRSDMLTKASGSRIDWTSEITTCIWNLWGAGNRSMICTDSDHGLYGQTPDGYRELSSVPYIYTFV